jgi:L-alanine-DL-glutamate epimerase-like enolase superfamily enzyme
MKITGISTRIVRIPYEEPLAGGPTPAGVTRDFVALQMRTDDGLVGVGVSFFVSALVATLKHAIDTLGALTVGEDPVRTEAIVAKLRAAAGTAGPGGVLTLAMSAIDMALWDLKGKALGLPVWKLLGAHRERVPTYASGALMREFPVAHLEKAARHLVERGFRQMKTQMGGEAYAGREVERIRRIREAIGDEIDLMCDINQKWTVQTAIAVGQQIEPYHLYWLEDVTAHDDYPGLARVAEALATPVAAGEYVYGIVPFRHMMEARSVDIVMIDLVRVGGITQWRKVAGMAEAFNLPVVSHLLPEIHVHLVAAIPNGLTVEYMPWSLRLWEETPQLENGMIVVPQKPGLGLKFDEGVLKRYGA